MSERIAGFDSLPLGGRILFLRPMRCIAGDHGYSELGADRFQDLTTLHEDPKS